jgi:molybdate transport system substrate-binding protein
VIVVPADTKLAVAAPKDLLKPQIKRIALAEPSAVPVGVYTSKYLTDEGLWEQLKPKVVPVQDVRATLAAVESGNVDAGFVYKTDAAISKKVKVAYEVPLANGPRIIYPAAVVKESQHKIEARAFLNYFSTPPAKAIFKKYGFVTLD